MASDHEVFVPAEPRVNEAAAQVASVILDIPAKTFNAPYSYLVPSSMNVQIGMAVRVPFGRTKVVGYVTQLSSLEAESNPQRLKSIEEVLSEPLFSASSIELAHYLADTYLAPLSVCIRLMFPAGAAPVVKKVGNTWQTIAPKTGEIDESWVLAGPQFDAFEPKKSAHRQQVIIDTVKQGPIRVSELKLLYGNIHATLKSLENQEVVTIESRRKLRLAQDLNTTFGKTNQPETLTEGQTKALAVIDQVINAPDKDAVLIDGVTGSGKTEIYLQAIQKILQKGQGAIVLVPEISLTPQTVARFRGRFGDLVAVMHSKMSTGEKYDQWDLIRKGAARIVIGPRSALFMPIQNLGLIVIDEEHEGTYKQESAPRYVSRDVALWLAKKRNISVVFGSATPSIESLYLAKYDPTWSYVALPERANGNALPAITVIDMTAESKGASYKVFSKKLENAILHELQAHHKVVLLLNQRGFARFLLCQDCGFVPQCSHCSTTLTYHEKGNKLVCHHCGYALQAPPKCPSCSSPYLNKFGIGTQRVEADLRQMLESFMAHQSPYAEDALQSMPLIIRMDADTTSKKGAHQSLLEEFAQADAAVLLGTQMIAKGLDFEDVTLVGVINADTMLHLPDFRASERTFNLIQQVAGRAGRAHLPGRVLIQTYEPDSVAIRAASHYDRKQFLANELPKREVLQYPPYVRMANVLIWGADEAAVKNVAAEFHKEVVHELGAQPDNFEVLTPVPCAFEKIRNLTRWHFIVKCAQGINLSAALKPLYQKRQTIKGVYTAIDIDPFDLL